MLLGFAREFAQNRQQERFGLPRARAGHDEQVLLIHERVADRFGLMTVRRIVQQRWKVPGWRDESGIHFQRSGRQTLDGSEAFAALIPGCRFDVRDLVNDSGTFQQFFALRDQGGRTDVVGCLNIVTQRSVQLSDGALNRLVHPYLTSVVRALQEEALVQKRFFRRYVLTGQPIGQEARFGCRLLPEHLETSCGPERQRREEVKIRASGFVAASVTLRGSK